MCFVIIGLERLWLCSSPEQTQTWLAGKTWFWRRHCEWKRQNQELSKGLTTAWWDCEIWELLTKKAQHDIKWIMAEIHRPWDIKCSIHCSLPLQSVIWTNLQYQTHTHRAQCKCQHGSICTYTLSRRGERQQREPSGEVEEKWWPGGGTERSWGWKQEGEDGEISETLRSKNRFLLCDLWQRQLVLKSIHPLGLTARRRSLSLTILSFFQLIL